MVYKNGTEVEICLRDDGFDDIAYYKAQIISKIKYCQLYEVEYENLLAEDGSSYRVERVSADDIRPLPPRPGMPTFYNMGEKVDAFYKEGWWCGTVVASTHDARYTILFESSGEKVVFRITVLRNHLEWVDGEWYSVNPKRFSFYPLLPSLLPTEEKQVEAPVAIAAAKGGRSRKRRRSR